MSHLEPLQQSLKAQAYHDGHALADDRRAAHVPRPRRYATVRRWMHTRPAHYVGGSGMDMTSWLFRRQRRGA